MQPCSCGSSRSSSPSTTPSMPSWAPLATASPLSYFPLGVTCGCIAQLQPVQMPPSSRCECWPAALALCQFCCRVLHLLSVSLCCTHCVVVANSHSCHSSVLSLSLVKLLAVSSRSCIWYQMHVQSLPACCCCISTGLPVLSLTQGSGYWCLQFAWRMDNSADPLRFLICVVHCIWSGFWHVGFHIESGAKCEHLQCFCGVLPMRRHCQNQ